MERSGELIMEGCHIFVANVELRMQQLFAYLSARTIQPHSTTDIDFFPSFGNLSVSAN